jgi:antitoxin component YwqK of YwqJK toxin-antitoxin module
MRYDEDGQRMLDLDSNAADWDVAGDCLLMNGIPFDGWAYENYEDGKLYSRTRYTRGYSSGLMEIYYENGQLMRRNGGYDMGLLYAIHRAWAENGQLILEEMNRGSIRVPAYQKEWSESGVLLYVYQSPATFQSYNHGLETWWYENGQLKEQKAWELGICMQHQAWSPDGQLSLDTVLPPDSPDLALLFARKEKESDMERAYGALPEMKFQ